jgi:hypothetical protein
MAEYSPIVLNTIDDNLGSTRETDRNRVNIEKNKAQLFINLFINVLFYFQINWRPTVARNIYGILKGSGH